MTDREPFVLYIHEGSPSIKDDLPDGYSFVLWSPTLRHPVPPTMAYKTAAWAVLHFCRLLANPEYRVVYIRQGERFVHRSCVLPRYFRWPFMNKKDLQVSSTWTEPEFRGKGLASAALAHVVRCMEAPGRRFWYVSRESNTASIHVCRRVGFKRFATGLRGSRFGVHALGELHVQHEAPMIGLEEGYSAKAGVDQASWYRHYYSKVGVARNDLRTSRGALFQTIASERAFIRAFHHISPYSSAMRVLDVGCAGGGSWYQLFRLGVSPSNTLGIDIQRSRLALLHNLYPQCSAVHADAVRIPFANASFDLVYESTMFATLTDDSVRARIADEMLRVCKPDGYLLLVDWKTPKAWDQRYKALTLAELRRLFEVGKTARLVGVFPGALVPPIGRLLSAYAGGLYFLVAVLCPLLVGQVAYLLRKHTGFSND